MKRKKHKLLRLILPLAFTAALLFSMTLISNAEGEVAYIDHEADGTPEDKSCAVYEELNNETKEWPERTSGWYVVSGDNIIIKDRITVSGTVNLILCDGAKLTALQGITVEGENKLNIYAQSEGSGMGKLLAGESGLPFRAIAAIGGSNEKDGGTVCIHGGNVTATGSRGGAGIGGGSSYDSGGLSGKGGIVIIYDGNVTATGGEGGAGIGGGYYGKGGIVTIYGGTVNATGGLHSAGIGGGKSNDGDELTVYGGNVTATGGEAGAGIGGGKNAAGGNVTVYDGTVNATGRGGSAGIGGGSDGKYGGNGSTVNIYGGNVTAIGNNGGVGIGAGSNGRDNKPLKLARGVTLYGGSSESTATEIVKEGGDYKRFVYMKTTYATPGPQPTVNYRKASWSGSEVTYTDEEITQEYTEVDGFETSWENGGWYVVNDTEVTISGPITVTGTANLVLCDGAKLTAKQGITVKGGNTLNIYAQSEGTGTLIAGGSDIRGAGIGGYSSDGGTVIIHDGKVSATGGDASAGIGGTFREDGGTVTIYGGKVTALGASGAAGIGGGNGGDGKGVTVYGGDVSAIGCADSDGAGAGIGGGRYREDTKTGGNGGTVVINGGTVKAYGGSSSAAGIGHGYDSTVDGTLTVGSGIKVYGGTSADRMPEITPNEGAYTRYQYMVASDKTSHIHDFSYAANGKTITATCSMWGCPLTDNKVSLSVRAADAVYSGNAYSGASLDSEDWIKAGLQEPTVKYEGRGATSYEKSTNAPKNVGTYTASVTVDNKTATADFEITQKALTIDRATATPRDYIKGKKDVEISEVTFKDSSGTVVELVNGTDYRTSGLMEDDKAGVGKNVNVTVTLINANCSLTGNTVTTSVDISKANAQTVTIPVTKIHTVPRVTQAIADKIPADAGSLTYTKGTPVRSGNVNISDFTVNNGNVAVNLSGGSPGDTVTLPVTIGSTNYNDFTINVVITLTQKIDVSVTIIDEPSGTMTYGDEGFTMTARADDESGYGPIRWNWSTSDDSVFRIEEVGSTVKVKIIKAGSATFTVKYETDTSIGTVTSSSIMVNPKDLTVKATDKNIKVGEDVPDLSHPVEGKDYTVEGLVGEDTMPTPTLLYSSAPDNTKAGTYQIYAFGPDAGYNYAVDYQDGTLTISEDKPAPAPAPTPASPADTTPVGSVHDLGGSMYVVTSANTASLVKALSKKSFTLPATVGIDGKTFVVTGINARAFKGTKVRTLTVKTTELTKASARLSLKGSKVRTVKVKVGKKKINRSYVKKYRKIFTKKNAGRKARVR